MIVSLSPFRPQLTCRDVLGQTPSQERRRGCQVLFLFSRLFRSRGRSRALLLGLWSVVDIFSRLVIERRGITGRARVKLSENKHGSGMSNGYRGWSEARAHGGPTGGIWA